MFLGNAFMRNPLRHGRWFLLTLGLILFELSAVSSAQAQAANPELDALLTKGVQFPNGQFRKLRSPTLADGLNADAQQKAIEDVLAMKQGRPITYAEVTVKNLNTPYVLLIDQDPNTMRTPRVIRSIFGSSSSGDLKKVSDPEVHEAAIPEG